MPRLLTSYILVPCLLASCASEISVGTTTSMIQQQHLEVSSGAITEATISWQTNVETISSVEYGTDSSYGHFTNETATPSTAHSFQIRGFQPNSEYHFRIYNRVEDQVLVSSDNSFRTSFPPQIAVGTSHVVALREDGKIVTWGGNTFDQLGRPTAESCAGGDCSSTPGLVQPLSNIVSVGAGNLFTATLRQDGTIWSFGRNSDYGQLGDGTFNDSDVPVQATLASGAPLSNVASFSAGLYHMVANLNDGTLVAWGRNQNGQLGNPGMSACSTSLPSQTRAISVTNMPVDPGFTLVNGGHFSFALTSAGNLHSWGYNASGQLARGAITTLECTPQQVILQVQKAAMGVYHGLAIRNDGTLNAWGQDSDGQLGNADGVPSSNQPSPVVVQIGGSAVQATHVAAADASSFALTPVGTVLSWGDNAYGTLGDGTTLDRYVPVSVLSAPGVPLDNVVAVFAGGFQAFAVRGDGSVWAWGYNRTGQLGLGQSSGPDQCSSGFACSKYAVRVPSL